MLGNFSKSPNKAWCIIILGNLIEQSLVVCAAFVSLVDDVETLEVVGLGLPIQKSFISCNLIVVDHSCVFAGLPN